MHSVQLWELACLRSSDLSRPISFGCTQSNCGSEPAREGGLTADLSLPDALGPIVGARLAREGGLPANPSLSDALGPIVGAGLPAKAACQPTHIFRMHSVQLWELACLRRRPASQPISIGCTQSNCGSEACPRRRPDSRPISFGCTRSN